MTNQLYVPAKQSLLDSTGPDLTVEASASCVLLLPTYTFDEGHTSYATHLQPHELDIVEMSGQATKVLLGVFDADDVNFTAVTGGTIQYVAIVIGDVPLLFIDIAAGLPIDASSAVNVSVIWSEAPEKIFSL